VPTVVSYLGRCKKIKIDAENTTSPRQGHKRPSTAAQLIRKEIEKTDSE